MAIVTRKTTSGRTRYMVRVADVDPVTGKRTNRNIGTFGTKREAEAAERKATVDRDEGTLVDRSRMTVAELLDLWLGVKEGELGANSMVGYQVACRRVAEALGGVQLQRLTTPMIQAQYTAWRDAGVGTRSIVVAHQRLKQALDMAVQHGLVRVNAAAVARPPKDEPKRLDVWSTQEIARFLDAAEGNYLWPLWPLLVVEGLRRGEALGLRWRDVDLENGTATIVQTVSPDLAHGGRAVIRDRGKSKAAHRTILLSEITIAALKTHRTKQAEERLASPSWTDLDLITCTRSGGPISPGGNVQRALGETVERAGLPRMTVHGLRHCAATMALTSGVPLAVLSKRLGHANIGVTADRYARVSHELQLDAAERVSAALAKARGA